MRCLILSLFLLISISMPANAQEEAGAANKTGTEAGTGEDNKEGAEEEQPEPGIEEQGFINYGYLSISVGFKFTPDSRYITYKIMNNTGLSIDTLYGWVYQIPKGDVNSATRVILTNNPSISGVLLSKPPHKPETVGTWRFKLRKKFPPEGKNYFLRVDDKSIFFVPFEYEERQVATLP